MRCLEIKREMRERDIEQVSKLLDAAASVDGRRPLSDHLYLDMVSGGHTGFAGLIADDPQHGHPVGYAQVSKGNDNHLVELVIDPHHRHETEAIGHELLHAAMDVVASEGGGEVTWWVFEPSEAHHQLTVGHGFSASRTLYQMRRPLPAERRATIETRAFVPGSDDEAWLKVNNRAFYDHGEQGGWTLDTFCQRQRESWFDPKGFRIHEVDGQMAGFCWTKVHHEPAGDLGEIYVIAVDPDFHGRGLGSEMTVAGLDSLTERGIGTALLYVDADNVGAVKMYEKLGFGVHATNIAYSATVVPRAGTMGS